MMEIFRRCSGVFIFESEEILDYKDTPTAKA